MAPTIVALHLNQEVCLQERAAVLAVRGGWTTSLTARTAKMLEEALRSNANVTGLAPGEEMDK